MAEARSAWRALRPVFLAGAATLTWLTFSSSAASADVLSDTTSLLGGVTSTVSSVTDKVAGPALPAPAAPPAAPAAAPRSPGLLGPVVGQVSGLADNVVAAVPVVNRVIPSGAVTVVSVPVAGVVDGATASVVDVVVPPVAGAVPVLEPVLEPVADLATGAAPLPVAVPELPVAVPELPVVPTDADLSDGADLSAGAVVTAGGPAGADDRDPTLRSPAAADVPAASAVQGPVSAGSVVGAVALADTASPLWAPAAEFDAGAGESGTADPSPAQAPAVPGSGAGSGTSASGSSGSAAWLSVFSVDLPVPGAVRAGESSEHVPAPVSLDPGSSPD